MLIFHKSVFCSVGGFAVLYTLSFIESRAAMRRELLYLLFSQY